MRCYVSLGSNLNSPRRQIAHALLALSKLPQTAVIKRSSIYLSEPLGPKAQPIYCNGVVELQTTLTPHTLLQYLQAIEKQQGRVKKTHWGARTIDLDLLLYGAYTLNTKTLTLPHPQLLTRDFVIIPLLEIAPNLRLPNGDPIILQDNVISFVRSTTL